jgi:hypothetical protein
VRPSIGEALAFDASRREFSAHKIVVAERGAGVESGNEASILAIYPACPATVLGMTALKQLAFSLAFAITAVAAAQYIMWILNGQP